MSRNACGETRARGRGPTKLGSTPKGATAKLNTNPALCNATKKAESSNPKSDFAKIKTNREGILLHTFWSALLSMRLHSDVRIKMIQCTIRLLTAIPSAFIHSLDLLIPPTWSFVLLCTRNRYKGIHLIIRVSLPDNQNKIPFPKMCLRPTSSQGKGQQT